MNEEFLFNLWEKAHCYETNPINNNQQKFFLIFAYPGTSGFLHVGHLRSYTYPDVIAKFYRLNGFNVYFPSGIHASGLPAISFSEKVRSGSNMNYLIENDCTPEIIEKLKYPEGVVEFFNTNYHDVWHKMGFFNDKNSRMTTIDPGYHKFIQWQFRKLYKNGFLIQKEYISPYCIVDGPVSIDTAETDLSEGGTAEIQKYTLIKFFVSDNSFIIVSTLRPETIFGVSNIWINPEAKYILGKVDFGNYSETWIIAEESLPNFNGFITFTDIEPIAIESLASMSAKVPITSKSVPIVGSLTVNPAIGSGLVMSVPAHSPSDWLEYQTIKTTIKLPKPIIIINSSTGVIPAEEICKKLSIKNIANKKIKEAIQELYTREMHNGIMNEYSGRFNGISVIEARKQIIEQMIVNNDAKEFYGFTEKVVCRCGRRIFIRSVPNQWFINYSDIKLTNKSKEITSKMKIYPESFSHQLNSILDWFGDRPCVRRGKWLGTEFPLVENNTTDSTTRSEPWIIEPISDSTIYPAYYIISKYINMKLILPDQLTDDFFEYIYFGIGTSTKIAYENGINPETLDAIRQEYLYWFPLDMNFGGKEHQTVHFPAFIKSHAAIFSDEYQPKSIFVNWWVYGDLSSGKKISKSKGGTGSIITAIKHYSADAIRLFYCHHAISHIDVEWKEEQVAYYQNLIKQIKILIERWNITAKHNPVSEKITLLETWINYMMKQAFYNVYKALESCAIREGAQIVFFTIPQLINRYMRRGGKITSTVHKLIEQWIIFISPFTPFMAEELWQEFGYKDSIFAEKQIDQSPLPPEEPVVVAEENYIENVIKDIKQVKKSLRKVHKISIDIYTDTKSRFDSNRSEVEVLKDAQEYMEKILEITVNINPNKSIESLKKSPRPFKVAIHANIR